MWFLTLHSLSLYVYDHVFMCIQVHKCACIYWGQRSTSRYLIFLTCLSTIYFKKGFLPKLGACLLARITGWQAPGLILSPEHWGYRCALLHPALTGLQMCTIAPGTYMTAGALNLDPHTYVASTLPTEPSPQPCLIFLFVLNISFSPLSGLYA